MDVEGPYYVEAADTCTAGAVQAEALEAGAEATGCESVDVDEL